MNTEVMSLIGRFENHPLFQHQGSHVSNADLELVLHINHWEIHHGQHWAVVGGSKDQRSQLIELLHQHIIKTSQLTCAEISPHRQQQLIDEEIRLSKNGLVDQLFEGTPVPRFIEPVAAKNNCASYATTLIDQLGFRSCMTKRFRQLSSGETRRLLIINALVQRPGLLLLNDPFDGLDCDTQPVVDQILTEALRPANPSAERPAISSSVYASSRPDQLSRYVTNLAYIDDHSVLHSIALDEKQPQAYWLKELSSGILDKAAANVPELPANHPFHQLTLSDSKKALVDMQNVCIRYADTDSVIFEHLDWRVEPFQHWRICGKNGSGKTSLLKLITGDHPQVYANHVEVCGFLRGSGESVWQVKRHIGYMSSEMLWNYRSSGRIAGNAINVVISGLYDSIGLYSKANPADISTALAWLALFELEHEASRRFQVLGLAEQRLVLIARAMIKRPALLILDEPLSGLDSRDRQRVIAIIEKLIGSNASTLLYVTHQEDECIAGVEHTLYL